jgi:hypothetical protein
MFGYPNVPRFTIFVHAWMVGRMIHMHSFSLELSDVQFFDLFLCMTMVAVASIIIKDDDPIIC